MFFSHFHLKELKYLSCLEAVILKHLWQKPHFYDFAQTHMLSQVLYFAGMTGHTEVVRVVFYPEKISLAKLLQVFWESHDPTQGTTSANTHSSPNLSTDEQDENALIEGKLCEL